MLDTPPDILQPGHNRLISLVALPIAPALESAVDRLSLLVARLTSQIAAVKRGTIVWFTYDLRRRVTSHCMLPNCNIVQNETMTLQPVLI